MNNAAVSIGLQVSVRVPTFNSFGYIPRSGIAGSRGNSFFFFNFVLFLAALGLHCWVQAFSSCSEQGLLFVEVCGLLIAVASLVAEHGL